MAGERTIFAITPDVTAATDLRSYQFKPVVVITAGVLPCTGAIASGPPWVLGNRPNSGQACTLYGPPNVVKAVAGATILRGNLIAAGPGSSWVPVSASFFGDSAGNGILVAGMALTAITSGNIFSLALR